MVFQFATYLVRDSRIPQELHRVVVPDKSALAVRLENDMRAGISRDEFFLDIQLFHGDPQGNHLWLKLPDAWSAETLERAAKENGVNVYSAASFTVANMPTPNAIRIALGAARNDSELRIGLNVVARLLKERTDPFGPRY